MTKQEETCGNCRFGQMLKEDLTMRECHGSPPQILVVPQQRMSGMGIDGKPKVEMVMNIVNARPKVFAKDAACGLYQRRALDLVAQDNTEIASAIVQ